MSQAARVWSEKVNPGFRSACTAPVERRRHANRRATCKLSRTGRTANIAGSNSGRAVVCNQTLSPRLEVGQPLARPWSAAKD